jgi:hypothetical protein
MVLHAVSTKEEQISLDGCRSTGAFPSYHPQITAISPRFLKRVLLSQQWREYDDMEVLEVYFVDVVGIGLGPSIKLCIFAD